MRRVLEYELLVYIVWCMERDEAGAVLPNPGIYRVRLRVVAWYVCSTSTLN